MTEHLWAWGSVLLFLLAFAATLHLLGSPLWQERRQRKAHKAWRARQGRGSGWEHGTSQRQGGDQRRRA